MLRTFLRAGVMATILGAAAGSAPAAPPPDPMKPWIPSTLEKTRLPPYCITNVIGGCGERMNHFCPGLVYLLRAYDLNSPKWERQRWARDARNEILYTKNGMKAGCPIAGDVRDAENRLNLIEKMIK